MGASSTTRVAGGAVLAMLGVAVLLVLLSDLRVQDLGPIIVYGVSLVAVVALVLAPVRKAR